MGTTAQKLQKAIQTKADIKNAINNKGIPTQITNSDTFASYANKINTYLVYPQNDYHIIENGTYDVTNYKNAVVELPVVNVATPTISYTDNQNEGNTGHIDEVIITPNITQPYGFTTGATKSGTPLTVRVMYDTAYSTSTSNGNTNSISFTGLKAEPFSAYLDTSGNYTTTTTKIIMAANIDEENVSFTTAYHSGNGSKITGHCDTTTSTVSACMNYSNGNLTITTPSTSNTGYFNSSLEYILRYRYLEVV